MLSSIRPETWGVARTVADPDNRTAELAIIVRSDWKGRGLGKELARKMVRCCRDIGLQEIQGEVQTSNHRILALVERFGFVRCPGDTPDTNKVSLTLSS